MENLSKFLNREKVGKFRKAYCVLFEFEIETMIFLLSTYIN